MPHPVLTEAVDRIASGKDLGAPDAAAVLREIMEGASSEAQSAAFLIALRTKGETVDELVGLARTMRERGAGPRRGWSARRGGGGGWGGRGPGAATTCSTRRAPAAGGRRSTCPPP